MSKSEEKRKRERAGVGETDDIQDKGCVASVRVKMRKGREGWYPYCGSFGSI